MARPFLTLFAVLSLALWFSQPAVADDTKSDKPAAKKADKPETATEAKPEAAEPTGEEMYQLPEGDDVAAYARFLNKLTKFRPSSREELLLHRKKAPLAMQKAAEKILELEKDTKSADYRMAKRVILQKKGSELAGDASDGDRKKFLDELIAFVESSDRNQEDLGMAMNYAIGLEYAPATELAKEAYEKLGALFAESKDEQVADNGKKLAGAARRLGLVGQPLELSGTTLDGKPFDISSLKGKVVLVDFWATWCGPCIAEIPNVKKNYAAYKDKGFEVVGVSLDRNREALEEFVAKEGTPWITLHEKDAGGQHPAATDYGIFGIPTVILLDKEGKVVSLRARGSELGKHLEALLGPPPAEDNPAKTGEATKEERKE